MRHRDLPAVACIVFSVKVAYFLDRETSFNFQTATKLTSWREWLYTQPVLITFLPLVGIALLERKIIRHYSFGTMQSIFSYGLTCGVGVYFYMGEFMRPIDCSKKDFELHVQ